jgi:hypothetical protein
MTPEELDSLDKPALIHLILAQARQIELLVARVTELESGMVGAQLSAIVEHITWRLFTKS